MVEERTVVEDLAAGGDAIENPSLMDPSLLTSLRARDVENNVHEAMEALLATILYNNVSVSDAGALTSIFNRIDNVELYNAAKYFIFLLINLKSRGENVKADLIETIQTQEEEITGEQIFNIIVMNMWGHNE